MSKAAELVFVTCAVLITFEIIKNENAETFLSWVYSIYLILFIFAVIGMWGEIVRKRNG